MTSTAPADAYPLTWPVGWQRTPPGRIERSRYSTSLGRAMAHLRNELKLFGARDVVLSSNLPLRRDGLPYSNVAQPRDCGIAVYWTMPPRNGQPAKPMVMACDQWAKVEENVHAIGLSVAAMRQIQRAGASTILERAFAGFAALPAGVSWRDVMGFKPGETPTLEQLKAMHRVLVLQNHPDRGGSAEAMVRINTAMDRAKVELGYTSSDLLGR